MRTNATPILVVFAIALLSRLYATHNASTPITPVSTQTTAQTPRIASQSLNGWRTLRAGETFETIFKKNR